ncbi:MAG: ArnT family glycosyltransferase [Candidatus Nanoarchaeia archaeon]
MKKYMPLFALLALVLVAKLIFLTITYHNPVWDEAVFIGMGKWISTSQETGLWEKIRPPGLPLSLSLIFNITNSHVFGADFLILLFTLGSIILTYLIGCRVYNQKVGLIAGLLIFLTPVFFLNSNRVLTGIPSLFFCLLAIYAYLDKKYTLSALACAGAFLFRYPAGLIFPVIAILILSANLKYKQNKLFKTIQNNLKPFLNFTLVFIFLLSLYLIYNKIAYNSFFEPLIMAANHQSTFAGNVTGPAYILFYPVLLFSSNILLIFAFFSPWKKRSLSILLPLITFFLYFTIIPHKKERFILLALPYLAIFAAAGIYRLTTFSKEIYYKMIVYFILLLLLMPSLISFYFIFTADSENFPKTKPTYVESYYSFIENELGQKILTSDPIPATFTNKKFIPFYQDTEVGLEVLKKNINHSDAVIYNEDAFPWNSTIAKKQKEEMKSLLKKESKSIKNINVSNSLRKIYLLN